MTERLRPGSVSESHIEPISLGRHLEVAGVGKAEILQVTQRNWSRVGVAECDGQRFFIKQFVDRVGRWHYRGFGGDAETSAQLGEEIAGIRVVPIMQHDQARLLTISPFIGMTTIDSISRRNGGRDGVHAARVGRALAAILEERTVPDGSDDVVVWKGLDPKNLGWSDDGTLWVFDFGPPTRISRHDAAGLAVAAGLLSRWVARPGLHLLSPERPILRGVCEPLAPMTTLAEVQDALERHKVLRLREPQREGLAGTATRLGVRTLGRIHWHAVNREAKRLFAQT